MTAESPTPTNPEHVNAAATPEPEMTTGTPKPEVAEASEPNATATAPDAATPDATTQQQNTPDPQAEAVDVAALQQQLADANSKAEQHWDALLRQKAEMDNLRKRNERELDNARKYALEKFATELLAVKDSMELGLEAATNPDTDIKAVHEGMSLTLKMFGSALEKFGIQEIAPQGQKFDPQYHEAMAMQPTADFEDGTVMLVHQKGYQLNERLIRPARVIVAKAIPAATNATNNTDES